MGEFVEGKGWKWTGLKQLPIIDQQVMSYLENVGFNIACPKCNVSYYFYQGESVPSIALIYNAVYDHMKKNHPHSKLSESDVYKKARAIIRWRETKRTRVKDDAKRQTEISDF